jgi:hypothetical protein
LVFHHGGCERASFYIAQFQQRIAARRGDGWRSFGQSSYSETLCVSGDIIPSSERGDIREIADAEDRSLSRADFHQEREQFVNFCRSEVVEI